MQNFRYILALLFFAVPVVLCMVDQGFALDDGPPPTKVIHSMLTLYLVNGAFGLLGGLVLNFRRFLVYGLSGLIGGLSMTAVALMYMGWRDHMIKLELAVIFFLGLVPAFLAYKLLDRLMPAAKDKVKA
jgi:hypothetical protein